MAVSTTPEPVAPGALLAPDIPNFREDERVQARYTVMLQRRIKTFGLEHVNSIRRNASTKRDELRDELNQAQAEWDRSNEIATSSREAYRAAYPQHVKKTRLIAPSVGENIRSLGAANKLYHAAEEAWRATEHAASNIRRFEHNELQLDIELKKALQRAPQVSKEVTESNKWLAEIHAEEELGAVKAKVDEIHAEREAFAVRLGAGTVRPEELRLRTFAEGDIKHIAAPIGGLLFFRVDQFGPKTYLIARDLRQQRFALPYDRGLEKLLDGVYDIVQSGTEVTVARTMREGTRIPMSPLDYFLESNGTNEVAAHDAHRRHQEFVRENRMIASMEECDESETAVRAALLAYATKT